MALYLLIFIIIIIFSFLEIISENKTFSRLGFLFLIAIMFVMSFIRWNTGTDWESYFGMYNWIKVPWEDFDTGMEKGYLFINHLGKYLFDSYTGVLFIFAIIVYICMIKAYTFFSRQPITTLLVSYCISFASIFFVRQNIALAILLVSLIFVEKKKFWLFLFTIFVASLFHRTAWVFILGYPIYNRYFKTRILILLIGLSIIFSLAASKFLISLIGSMGLGIVSQKIEMYLDAGTNEGTMSISSTAVLIKGLVNRIFLLVMFFVFLGKERLQDVRLNGLINVYILGTILYCATLPISISLARIAVYMDMVQIFIIPYLIYSQKRLRGKLLLFGILLTYFALRLYSNYISFEQEFTPFVTIFD